MKKSTCFFGDLKKLNNKDLDGRKYDASANSEEDAPQEMLLSI